MKKILVYVSTLALGAGVGVTASNLYFKKKYKREYIDKATKIVAHYKDYISKKYPAETEVVKEIEEKAIPSIKKTPLELHKEKQHAIYDIQVDAKSSIKYDGFYQTPSNITKEEEKVLAENESPSEDDVKEDIYSISYEEVGNNPEFTQEDLTLYVWDGILVDEHDDVLDAHEILGSFADTGLFKSFDTCYVRNERLATDYTIMKVRATYDEV